MKIIKFKYIKHVCAKCMEALLAACTRNVSLLGPAISSELTNTQTLLEAAIASNTATLQLLIVKDVFRVTDWLMFHYLSDGVIIWHMAEVTF